jgi:hypothetical protein
MLGVSAASASAGDVWLWACHGPQGQPVDADIKGGADNDADFGTYGSGCAGNISNVDDGGMRLRFSRETAPGSSRDPVADPEQGSMASLNLNTLGAPVSEVQIWRRAAGFGGAGQAGTFVADLDGAGRLEELTSDASGIQTFVPATPGSGGLTLSLACKIAPRCAGGPAYVDVAHIAMRVTDNDNPSKGAVGRNDPVDKTMVLNPQSSDAGVGLSHAELRVDGVHVKTAGFGNCTELSLGDSTIDRPLDASRCPQSPASTTLEWDTSGLPEGVHRRVVTIFDAAGNSVDAIDETFTVVHPNPGTNTQTLNIGTSGPTVLPGTGSTGSTGSGGVAGTSAQSCRTPRLSMFLSQKPLRVRKGVPVLKRNKRYRFNGRLTCVINGKRKSAPKRARVDILNKVGKKTVEKAGTTVRDSGRLTIILSYRSSRLLTFRFTSADGQRSQVRIRIRVARK